MLNSSPVLNARLRNHRPASRIRALKIAPETLEGLAGIFQMLSDESRLKILLALARDGELDVSTLCELLGDDKGQAQQPAVSHHLKLLRMAGLVGFRRAGKHNYYRIESGLVHDLLDRFFSDTGNGHKALHFEEFSIAFKPK